MRIVLNACFCVSLGNFIKIMAIMRWSITSVIFIMKEDSRISLFNPLLHLSFWINTVFILRTCTTFSFNEMTNKKLPFCLSALHVMCVRHFDLEFSFNFHHVIQRQKLTCDVTLNSLGRKLWPTGIVMRCLKMLSSCRAIVFLPTLIIGLNKKHKSASNAVILNVCKTQIL